MMIYPFNQYLNYVHEHGPKLIITSSFEGRVGILQLQRLIQRMGLENTYHGLDSLRYFESQYDSMPDCALEKAST